VQNKIVIRNTVEQISVIYNALVGTNFKSHLVLLSRLGLCMGGVCFQFMHEGGGLNKG